MDSIPSYGKLHSVHPSQKEIRKFFYHLVQGSGRADPVPFLLLSWLLCHQPHCEDNVSRRLTLEVASCKRIHSRAKVDIDLWDHECLQVLCYLIPRNNLTKQNILEEIWIFMHPLHVFKSRKEIEKPKNLIENELILST